MSFPSDLSNLTNPTATDTLAAVPHSAQHSNANNAIEALETTVGVTGSAVTSSHDYRIAQTEAHVTNTSNPHSVTATQVGLGNVDNTSDANKPVSTATQTALDGKVDENVAITGATKTKITYDAKGLVTAGADATTADIAASTDKNYVTDAQLVVIGNTSGTNTGDNAANTSSIAKTTNITALNETGIADGEIAVFNLTNKDIRTSDKTIVTTLGTDDTTVPTSKAVKDVTDTKVTGFADPNADRILFWDDSAGAFAALAASTGLTISGTNMTARAASATQTGIIEIATDAETVTGTDTGRATTPANITARLQSPTTIGSTAPNTGKFTSVETTGAIELGAAADTTLSRVSAGVVAIEGNNIITAATVPVKASGAELDTGTDDAKFATAKALKDSHNVPSVIPGTSGNLLTSNGTDWTSAAAPVSVSVTTKGDLQTFSTVPDRLPVGLTNGHVLTVDSAEATGLKWAAASAGGTPGGSDTQLQFNDGGAFGGDADLTWNKTTNTQTIAGGIEATVSGYLNKTPITATIDSSHEGSPQAILGKNANNYAHAGNIAKLQMLNASDSGAVLKLENAGTGNYITADSVFSVTKAGLVTAPSVKITTGAGNGKILTSDADGDATWETNFGSNSFVYETPSGTVNGSNTAFTITSAPISGSLEVFRDGVAKYETNDWTLASTTITFVTAPLTGSVLRVKYQVASVASANADTLDGQHGSYYASIAGVETLTNKTLTAPRQTNDIMFRVSRNAAANTGNGAFATVAFDTEQYDLGADVASGVFTAPLSGYYTFSWGIQISVDASVRTVISSLFINNAEYSRGNRANAPASASFGTGGSDTVYITSGQTADIRAFGAVTLALEVGATNCWFSGRYISS